MNWRRYVILKKGLRYCIAPIRSILRHTEPNHQICNLPVIINSFPKSGTHLLLQIIKVIPGLRDWGLFLASTPSFTFRETSITKMVRNIGNIANRELALAHMHFSNDVQTAVRDRSTVTYFIYRDPRDVVISEAYYLTYGNKWHKLHKYFKSLPDMNSRILLSIQGAKHMLNHGYPNINKRFNRYKAWISQNNVLSIRFEDLLPPKRSQTISKIMQFYADRVEQNIDVETLVQNALVNINPYKSHTFRKGQSKSWDEMFTPIHKAEFKKIAGKLLIELEYEKDYSW